MFQKIGVGYQELPLLLDGLDDMAFDTDEYVFFIKLLKE